MKMLFAALLLVLSPAMADERAPLVDGNAPPNTICDYPKEALAAEAEGTTQLSFIGMSDGTLRKASVVRSSGNADLDKAALTCLSQWRFDPASKDNTWVYLQTVFIEWKIKDGSNSAPLGRRIGRPHSCAQYYPKKLIRAHTTGMTGLRFFITEEGKVRDIQVRQSSGSDELDKAAVFCATYWRYKPAIKNEKAVEVEWSVNIPWSLDEPMVVVERPER